MRTDWITNYTKSILKWFKTHIIYYNFNTSFYTYIKIILKQF